MPHDRELAFEDVLRLLGHPDAVLDDPDELTDELDDVYDTNIGQEAEEMEADGV